MNESNIIWIYWAICALLIFCQHKVIKELSKDKAKLEELGQYIIKADGRLEKKKGKKCK